MKNPAVTTNRKEIILASIEIAKHFNLSALKPNNPAIVAICARSFSAKSLIIEAMMKTLLDQHDPLDMITPGEQSRMYLETNHAEASLRPLFDSGQCNGQDLTLMMYNRIVLRETGADQQIKECFSGATAQTGTPLGIYFTIDDIGRFDEENDNTPNLTLHPSLYIISRDTNPNLIAKNFEAEKWNKIITIDDQYAGLLKPGWNS